MSNRNTGGLAIDVDTRNAVVTLSGSVKSDAEAELAGRIAQNTRGVSSVENQLTVGEGSHCRRRGGTRSP
ncbi:BON domain-containing protein [Marinobacterium aestuariivivens]|uniref:BON domain-containing protein n=1 Tax=Marinobacterium aestuariivivens TaxID=1698799 RepID=A0ABW1ZXL8_9GAMM